MLEIVFNPMMIAIEGIQSCALFGQAHIIGREEIDLSEGRNMFALTKSVTKEWGTAVGRDFPNETDFPKHTTLGMPRTIRQYPGHLNCHPIRQIGPLSWGFRLPAKRKSPESPATVQLAPLG